MSVTCTVIAAYHLVQCIRHLAPDLDAARQFLNPLSSALSGGFIWQRNRIVLGAC